MNFHLKKKSLRFLISIFEYPATRCYFAARKSSETNWQLIEASKIEIPEVGKTGRGEEKGSNGWLLNNAGLAAPLLGGRGTVVASGEGLGMVFSTKNTSHDTVHSWRGSYRRGLN